MNVQLCVRMIHPPSVIQQKVSGTPISCWNECAPVTAGSGYSLRFSLQWIVLKENVCCIHLVVDWCASASGGNRTPVVWPIVSQLPMSTTAVILLKYKYVIANTRYNGTSQSKLPLLPLPLLLLRRTAKPLWSTHWSFEFIHSCYGPLGYERINRPIVILLN
jgi:hypothetical protein